MGGREYKKGEWGRKGTFYPIAGGQGKKIIPAQLGGRGKKKEFARSVGWGGGKERVPLGWGAGEGMGNGWQFLIKGAAAGVFESKRGGKEI